MRIAIYSRFSSELQDARSIVDQASAARSYAEKHGWSVVVEFSDAAISGASLHNRPGLAALMSAAHSRGFDAVVTESIDRLSRDLEDIAGLYKRLDFLGVKIFTLADGEIGKLHVGLKGMIASMFVDDLALKTRRGQIGRAKSGRVPGGNCYGYDIVPTIDDRGQRAINQPQAEIVRRIFTEFVNGDSALKIAARLNAEGIPGPGGRLWTASAINGSRKRANGLINNKLYAGKIVFNRQKFVKDPVTGKRQARPNLPEQWVETEAAALQIVSDKLFNSAQALKAPQPNRRRLEDCRRPRHVFSGLLKCGCCRAPMTIHTRDRFGCSTARSSGTCKNRRTVSAASLEARVLASLKSFLAEPRNTIAAVEAHVAERQKLAAVDEIDLAASKDALRAVEKKLGTPCDWSRRALKLQHWLRG